MLKMMRLLPVLLWLAIPLLTGCGPSFKAHYQIELQLSEEVSAARQEEALQVLVDRLSLMGKVTLPVGADAGITSHSLQLSSLDSLNETYLAWLIESQRDAYVTVYHEERDVFLLMRMDSTDFVEELAQRYEGSIAHGFTIPQSDTAVVAHELRKIISSYPVLSPLYIAWEPDAYEKESYHFLILHRESERIDFSFGNLARATPTFSVNARPAIAVELQPHAHKLWEEFTGRHITKRVPVILDGRVLINPVVQSSIPGGKLEISGNFEPRETKLISALLSAPALPAGVKIKVTSITAIDPEALYKD